MKAVEDYRIVRLPGGACSVHSLAHSETFHPVVGPTAEAETLYVKQLNLPERVRHHAGEFVLWDVGLGAAANPITVLRATRETSTRLRIISFDHTLEPLRFALRNVEHLDYLSGFEDVLDRLLELGTVTFADGEREVHWETRVADFPGFLEGKEASCLPKPHTILFDAFSPAKNPAMWTLPLFTSLFQLLDPATPCALPTYSRSTLLRVTLLLAGFNVGRGQATGEKEETTIAANTLDLIWEPLDSRWLQRARRSTSAEPLTDAQYRQAPLSEEHWERLQAHPQFH